MSTTIGMTMRAIRTAIAGSGYSDEAEEEIAFHIADILGDLPPILALVRAGNNGEKVSFGQLDEVLSLICVHWEYHQKALRQLRRRVKPPGSGRAPGPVKRPKQKSAKHAKRSRKRSK